MSEEVEMKPCPFCGGEIDDMGKADHPAYFATTQNPTRYAVNCSRCLTMGPFAPSTNGAILAWNARAAPKVKALEWKDFEGMGAKAGAYYQANYMITLWRGRGQFEVSFSYPGHGTGYDGERFHDSLEAAKAAAQADYEARILAALE
ncbi:hypothetical protein [Roseinatronobacter sp. NSM]|uniref:hypothetical protein n=1 Tax=Roseinatronobacter sp. NSM TaxID=3457785 RepID=UPI004035A868